MGRIGQTFDTLKSKGQKALVVYLMGGDPNLGLTEELIPFLAELGVDLVEIGVPFSDPLADGPTIQAAGQRALQTTLPQLVEMVVRLRSKVEIPLLFMTYINPVLHRKYSRFVSEIADAGLDGVIIPDLTPEEGTDLIQALKIRKIDFIPLLAPTSTDERILRLTSLGSGFLYYVSRTGTTGARNDIAADLNANLKRIRAQSALPIGVGFGISTPNQAAEVTAEAEAAIIGSAVVKRMEQHGANAPDLKRSLSEFLKPIIERLHR